MAVPVADAPEAAPSPAVVQTGSAPGPASPYERGVRAFEAGELKKAALAWRESLDKENDPAARQRILFALAAVKLVLAGNDTDLATAMDLFDTWAANSPPGGSGEDPRLLVPLVHAFRPAFALKELKVAGDKECSKKLAEREQQVRRMQQQVKALETIHREIQEKKKGLTNY
jgi:hypothetical protein